MSAKTFLKLTGIGSVMKTPVNTKPKGVKMKELRKWYRFYIYKVSIQYLIHVKIQALLQTISFVRNIIDYCITDYCITVTKYFF